MAEAALYYGNGTCYLIDEGTPIRAVDIRYKGAITIDDKTPEEFTLMSGNNAIIIFPLGEGSLYGLFDYEGEIRIKSVIAVDSDANRVKTSVHRVMDYSELINSNSEDMTNLSEELSSGYISGTKPSKTTLKQPIIANLHTSGHDVTLYLHGKLYEGYFHIHKENGSVMTGAEHTKESEDLYFLIKGKLIPTKKEIKKTNRRRTSGGY